MNSYIDHLPSGDKFYYKDKECKIRHRTDGPAVEWENGSIEYWQDGKLHNLNGPAVVWHTGDKEWWVNGVKHTEEQFDKLFAYVTVELDMNTMSVELLQFLLKKSCDENIPVNKVIENSLEEYLDTKDIKE